MSEVDTDTAHHWPALASVPREIGFPLLRRAAGQVQPETGASLDAQVQRTPAEQRALQAATDEGYAAGLESGRQAAEAEVAQRLGVLDANIVELRAQLKQWSAALEAEFSDRCQLLLSSLLGQRLKVSDTFYSELLQEAATDLHTDVASLRLVIASDLQTALPDHVAATVDPELLPGEIRMRTDTRVAQLMIPELVAQALDGIPTMADDPKEAAASVTPPNDPEPAQLDD